MPILHFGGGTVGEGVFATADDTSKLLDTLAQCKIDHIDSASVYPMSAPGASERLIGTVKAAQRGFVLDSKIAVTGDGPGQGSLRKEAIDESLTRSLTALSVNQINVLYCHLPDTATSVEETAAALHDHHGKGSFRKIGLSNYSVDQVEEFMSVCEKHGWTKPSVYQGQYNAVCRRMETDLLPTLRRHGMTYVAFSPLAGGFLTGNFSMGKDLSGTRFADGNAVGARYRPMYDKPLMHSTMKELHAFLEPRGIPAAEASLRWMAYHSALGDGDGMIIGATSLAQIKKNAEMIGKGPLEQDVVEMFEKSWEKVKAVAP